MLKEFAEHIKSKIIAPAGYGKTFSIVESLKYTHGKQLILTHTHAGVASIKAKLNSSAIKLPHYNVETISSFAQKYFQAFYVGDDTPNQEDSSTYHSFVLDKCIKIFSSPIIQKVIKSTYNGMFIDEYQDCTKRQHDFVMLVAKALPVHILADPLQAIFDFNGPCVDFENDLKEFQTFPALKTPFRWYQEGNNKSLGDYLKGIRLQLEQKSVIRLVDKPKLNFHVLDIKEKDIFDKDSFYRKKLISILLNTKNTPDLEKSVLFILPEYMDTSGEIPIRKGHINDRVKIKRLIDFSNSLVLLEAIDDKEFYSVARKCDDLILKIQTSRKKTKKIKEELLINFFSKTELGKWIKDNSFTVKKKNEDKEISKFLMFKFADFSENPSPAKLCDILTAIKEKLKLKITRQEVYSSLLFSLKNASMEKLSVYNSMKKNRNIVRRVGRKVVGKCIGSTLLTKGLEFDTVIILNAHRFTSPKHFYVAITRPCKRLIVFTENKELRLSYNRLK